MGRYSRLETNTILVQRDALKTRLDDHLAVARQCDRYSPHQTAAIGRAWAVFDKIRVAEDELVRRGALTEDYRTDEPPYKRYSRYRLK